MKTIVVVIPPKPVSGLAACLAVWEGRLEASVATTDALAQREQKPPNAPSTRKPSGLLARGRFDGIVLMDGLEGQASPLNYHALIEQLQVYDKKKKLVAAVGTSCLFLAQAGLLVGKPATASSMPQIIEAVRRYGAIYTASPLVRSGWLITADGTDMAEFANAIAEMLLM